MLTLICLDWQGFFSLIENRNILVDLFSFLMAVQGFRFQFAFSLRKEFTITKVYRHNPAIIIFSINRSENLFNEVD